jgi:hypothetical protein
VPFLPALAAAAVAALALLALVARSRVRLAPRIRTGVAASATSCTAEYSLNEPLPSPRPSASGVTWGAAVVGGRRSAAKSNLDSAEVFVGLPASSSSATAANCSSAEAQHCAL